MATVAKSSRTRASRILDLAWAGLKKEQAQAAKSAKKQSDDTPPAQARKPATKAAASRKRATK